MSLVEILKKGIKLGIPAEGLDFIAWEFDFDNWQRSFPGLYLGMDEPYSASVDNYIASAGQS